MQTLPIPILSAPRPKQSCVRWAILGDSLVYGFGDPIGGGWVERMRRQGLAVGHTEQVVYNLGVRGDGVRQVLARLEGEFRSRGELRNQVPDVLVLSIGTNDSPRLGKSTGRNFLDHGAFEVAMAELLDRSQALAPVLFVGMPPVVEAKMPFLDCLYYTQAEQYRYKEATRQLCCDRGIPYLDIFDRWLAHGTSWHHERMSCDGLHPNSLGYETLFQDVLGWREVAELGFDRMLEQHV